MSNKSSMFMSSDSLNDTRIFSAPHKTVCEELERRAATGRRRSRERHTKNR